MGQKPERLSGRTGWSCPSNIAIVKYWGKRPVQLPLNPSLSMTLSHCRTETSVAFSFDPGRTSPEIHFRFEGRENPGFLVRVRGYTGSLLEELPLLAGCRLEIDSRNSFPHSSGIASSASAMGALALCYLEISNILEGSEPGPMDMKRASHLARLGSGSAARSLFPGMVLWGATDAWTGSSNEAAMAVKDYHPAFREACDSILVISSREKDVSSSAGHRIMDGHPFARSRYFRASENTARLKGILEAGDWPAFISLMEEEALTLHALMMSGRPSYLLLEPDSLAVIRRVVAFREDTGRHLGFTLDAGANVHLVYDAAHRHEVRSFIGKELVPFCEGGRVIHDQMGSGPGRLEG